MRTGPVPIRSAFLWLFAALLLPCVAACGPNGRRNRSVDARALSRLDSAAPSQAEIDEALGAGVAILVDTSGSMRNYVPGESRAKYIVAREALEAMLDATDDFVARRPDFPIKIGVYSLSRSVSNVSPIQPYDRATVRAALAQLPRPGGGTAIGEAMPAGRAEVD